MALKRPNSFGAVLFVTLSGCLVLGVASMVFFLGSLCEENRAAQAVRSEFSDGASRISHHVVLLLTSSERNDAILDIIHNTDEAAGKSNFRNVLFTQFITAPLSTVEEAKSAQIRAKDLQLALLNEDLGELKAQLISRMAIDTNLKDTKKRIKKLAYEHSLVALDMSELLSLPSVYSHENEVTEIYYYRKGIFKSLPMLDGLSDNIENVEALRDELSRAGGKVKLSDEMEQNAAEIFNQQIASLRKISDELVSDFEKASGELKSSQAEREIAIDRVKLTQKNIREKSKDLFLSGTDLPHTDMLGLDFLS